MGLEQANFIRERFMDPEAPRVESKYMFTTPYRKLDKTWVYLVSSKKGVELGRVQWWGPWRQYTFQPHTDTIFSPGCLNDISVFIKMLMDERKTIKETKLRTGD